MPNWNLYDDWPQDDRPVDSKSNLPVVLFSVPVKFKDEAKYALAIDNKEIKVGNKKVKVKRLVIDIQTNNKVEVLAMVPGVLTVSGSGKEAALTTDIFSLGGISLLFGGSSKSSKVLPVAWFRMQWIAVGRIPRKIIYENVKNAAKSCVIKAGEKIGEAQDYGLSKKRFMMSIEYEDSTPTNKKFMHPREFFSLLFWKEECDPILKDTPKKKDYYAPPLLRKMMSTYEDGTPAYPYINKASDVINRDKDDWLGLRPPLRTYQRVKWEHIKEHLRTDYRYHCKNHPNGKWTGRGGNISSRILNPFIYKGGTYGYGKGSGRRRIHTDPDCSGEGEIRWGYTKCNIFAGEMLYRAGFRTIAYGQGIGCKASYLPRFIKYCTPNVMLLHFTEKLMLKGAIHHDSNSQSRCSTGTTATHKVFTVCGSKQKCDKKTINQSIQNTGSVFLLTSDTHIAIVDKVVNCTYDDNGVSKRRVKSIQQWHGGFSRSSYSDTWDTAETSKSLFVWVRPGGDPTEEWGRLDLNCLEIP